jgi:RNA polymerase sigma-70 factor (ECF subfamily)
VDDLTRLVLAAQAGDQISLAAFVRQTQPEVWRLCARLGDRAHADDLTQEVFLRALPAIEEFRADASARTWLLRIARNTCVDHVRRQTRRRSMLARIRPTDDVGVAADPSGTVELDDLVAGLDADRREAFVLTQVLGCSYAEAAEVAGVPVGTIRSRVARARSDLIDAWSADRATG